MEERLSLPDENGLLCTRRSEFTAQSFNEVERHIQTGRVGDRGRSRLGRMKPALQTPEIAAPGDVNGHKERADVGGSPVKNPFRNLAFRRNVAIDQTIASNKLGSTRKIVIIKDEASTDFRL